MDQELCLFAHLLEHLEARLAFCEIRHASLNLAIESPRATPEQLGSYNALRNAVLEEEGEVLAMVEKLKLDFLGPQVEETAIN